MSLRLRARIDEFEIATKQSGHNWALFDLTDSFAQWLCSHKYAQSYFKKPNLLATVYHKYRDYIIESFTQVFGRKPCG
jgi:AraC-like DNA-binding protein